jgi:hypothetical protein
LKIAFLSEKRGNMASHWYLLHQRALSPTFYNIYKKGAAMKYISDTVNRLSKEKDGMDKNAVLCTGEKW